MTGSMGARVLCIDDEVLGLEIRKVVFERAGYTVLTALEGNAAIKVFMENQIDAVVLDYAMPGMNGSQVARALRQLKPEVPILLLSAYLSFAGRCAEMGGPDCQQRGWRPHAASPGRRAAGWTIRAGEVKTDLNLHAFNRVLRTNAADADHSSWHPGRRAGVADPGGHRRPDQSGVCQRSDQRLYQLQAFIVDEETGLRGYQLTADRQMLEPYITGQQKAEQQLDSLAGMLTSPEQRLRLAQIRDDYALWKGYATPSLGAGKQDATPGDRSLPTCVVKR